MENNLGFDGGLTCSMQCADLGRAIAWYENNLGFSLLYKVDELGWCEMQTPVEGVSLGLSEVETPEVKGGATLTFGVSDIEGARTTLEGLGVSFDGDTVVYPGMVSLATFYDLDGNKLMLYRDLSESS